MIESSPTHQFVAVCESQADQRTACDLADRVCCSSVDWLESEQLTYLRAWVGVAPGYNYLKWSQVKREAKARGIKLHGHFGGTPGAPDAFVARQALALLTAMPTRPAAVLLIRDSDGDARRKDGDGLQQARNVHPWEFKVIVGVAHCKRECWVLNGFIPRNDFEKEVLKDLKGNMGFDPCQQAEKLTASTPGAKRDAKQAAECLTGGDFNREAACWRNTPLEILKQRGVGTGLTRFLEEVQDQLAPLFSNRVC